MQLKELVKLDELLSVLSGRISASINRHLNRRFRDAGLDITSDQWLIMVCLWNRDNLTQQEISDLTYKDKASITRLLDSMEKTRLIERLSDPTDRRINIVHLTSKGKEMEEIAMKIVKEAFSKAVDGIDPNDLLFTKNTLVRVLQNII